MKKAPRSRADQHIPELGREHLGVGVRGKYRKRFAQTSNVVVLWPEIHRAFPTSEAVNMALASLLAFAKQTQNLIAGVKRVSRKRPAA
jgi:hypothetical protein